MPPEPRPINLKKTPSLTILLAIAMVNVCGCLCYGPGQMLRAREAVLKEDLYTLRNSIDQYTHDKQRAPQSLNELVGAGYLRVVPTDPFTRNADWKIVLEGPPPDKHLIQPGLSDVHSNSSELGADGTAYSSW
jgi:general secretion pathway protein G